MSLYWRHLECGIYIWTPQDEKYRYILGQVQQMLNVLEHRWKQTLRNQLGQPGKEKAEVKILLLSTTTYWKDIKITEPDSSQKCTMKWKDAAGRSCYKQEIKTWYNSSLCHRLVREFVESPLFGDIQIQLKNAMSNTLWLDLPWAWGWSKWPAKAAFQPTLFYDSVTLWTM